MFFRILALIAIIGHQPVVETLMPLAPDYSVLQPKLSQQTQCVFHEDLYDIGEKWRPTIEPFGVYYCILCECVAVKRKKDNASRIAAKVQCRNFKKDCPKLECENPVLLPERCCKSCPGDTNNIEEMIASQKLEEAMILKTLRKRFYAILADSSDQQRTGKAFLFMARQRMAFIALASGPEKPKYLRFQDRDDTIIEEFIVQNNENIGENSVQYQIYGIWRTVPKIYRGMMRKGHIKFSLSFQKDINEKSSLSGIIRKHNNSIEDLSEFESYYEMMENQAEFGKSKSFEQMLNTTSFVSFESSNDLTRKAMMDQSHQSNWNTIRSNYKCYYEGQIYDEMAQWKNTNDDCEMCFCQRGRIKCESEICPKLRCRDQVRVPGQCCPVCKRSLAYATAAMANTSMCYFEADKKHYRIGSRWHPYVAPFGFDRCTTCVCAENSQIKCRRQECPTLRCSQKDSYLENPMDCCPKCRAETRSMSDVDPDSVMGDQADDNPIQQIVPQAGSCRFKGMTYANGQQWHPIVEPYGEISCIRCSCKDGIHRCQRISCSPTPPGCRKIIRKGECCPICAERKSPTDDNGPIEAASGRKRFRMGPSSIF